MIVILTALDVEYMAVRARLAVNDTHEHDAGTLYDLGETPGGTHVALAVIGAGTTTAAALAERAVAEFSPRAVLFVGIAGALSGWLNIGDVVVAEKVYAHQGALLSGTEELARPRAYEGSHRLLQLAQRVGVRPRLLPNGAKVLRCPITSGDVLLNSAEAPLRKQLHRTYNDAVAIEMESAGYAQAIQLNHSVEFLTVRGISDHADGTKETTDREGCQTVAAENAAAVAIAVIDDLKEQETKSTSSPKRTGKHKKNGSGKQGDPGKKASSGKKAKAPQGTFTNTMKDNAQIGSQVIGLTGGITVNGRMNEDRGNDGGNR
jgi:adenosylhomocysteine nucleosidase